MRGQLCPAAVKHRESHVTGGRDPAAGQNELESFNVTRAGVGQHGEKRGNPPVWEGKLGLKRRQKIFVFGMICPAGHLLGPRRRRLLLTFRFANNKVQIRFTRFLPLYIG